MKKIMALFLVLALMSTMSYVGVFAEDMTQEVSVIPEKYTKYVTEAIDQSAFTEEEIYLDKIFIIENTSHINMKKDIEPVWIWVALPIKNSDDISYAGFDNGKYLREDTNFASFNGMVSPYNGELDEYITDNNLSTPTQVKNMWISERVHVFAYDVICDGAEYIIPYCFTDESTFNKMENESCVMELGKAYTAEEFISFCEKEAELYAAYMAEEREKDNRPTVSLDENGDEVIKVNGINLDDLLNFVIETIESMKYGSTINFGIKTEKDNYITKYRKQGDGSVDDVVCFAEVLFDELKTQITAGKPAIAANTSYCKIKGSIIIKVWEDGVSIQVGKDNSIEFKIKNSASIIDIIRKYSIDAFEGFACEKNDENKPHIRGNLEGLTKTDVIEFEFILPSDTDNDISKEVASPGKNVTGTFERYRENKYRSTYILTLSGNLGTISFWTQTQSSLSGEQEIFSNNIPVSFSNRLRFEDGNIVEYKVGKESASYKFKMVFVANDISEAYFEGVECYDLKYTQLTEDTKLSDEFVEKNKEVVIREAKECADTLYDFGLFKGTDKGYELEKSLTREESATILVRLLGEEDKLDSDNFDEVFVDVDKDRWSYAYVMYCYENDITKGTGTDTFSPDVQIDASQFVTLLMRLLGYTEVNPDTAMVKSIEYNLLPADKVEDLTQKTVFTRSDMVQILYNSLKTKMDDETVFADYLLEKGILTEKELEQII